MNSTNSGTDIGKPTDLTQDNFLSLSIGHVRHYISNPVSVHSSNRELRATVAHTFWVRTSAVKFLSPYTIIDAASVEMSLNPVGNVVH